MSDIAETVHEALEKSRESRLNTAVAALVALTATFMAVCNVKDGNIVQAMQQAQANGVDEWSHYQSKSTKQHLAEQMVDQLTIQREITSNLTLDGRALLERKIIDYTASVTLYEEEKEEIRKRAEGFQKLYDDLNFHDDQFDMTEASCAVSIALFGVTALTQKRWLLLVAMFFSGFGVLLGLAAFAGWNVHPDFVAKILG